MASGVCHSERTREESGSRRRIAREYTRDDALRLTVLERRVIGANGITIG